MFMFLGGRQVQAQRAAPVPQQAPRSSPTLWAASTARALASAVCLSAVIAEAVGSMAMSGIASATAPAVQHHWPLSCCHRCYQGVNPKPEMRFDGKRQRRQLSAS